MKTVCLSSLPINFFVAFFSTLPLYSTATMPMAPLCPDPSKNTMASLLSVAASFMASSLESGMWIVTLSLSFGLPLHGFIDLNMAGWTWAMCMTSCNGALCDFTYLFAAQSMCFVKGCDCGRVAILVAAV